MHCDLLIRNATVVDGTRAPRYRADIAVQADRITAIGDLQHARAAARIDATGLIAAPGFIDAHTHDDRALLSSPDMAPKVSQGVTTVVTGNCGISLAPWPHAPLDAMPAPLDLLGGGECYRFRAFADYREALEYAPAAVNAACLVGHTTLRAAVLDRLDRAATPSEVARMHALAHEALSAGASGISTGTFYPPAAAATMEEILGVCGSLKQFGGLYATHLRDETDHVMESLDETFAIGRALGVPVVISHHKVAGACNHGRSAETLPHIERAMREQPVALDCYPYDASSTMLKADRVRLASRVLIAWSKPHPEAAGRELGEVARSLGLSIEDAVTKLAPAGAVYFMMDEADVRRILAFPDTMIGSDGLPHDTRPHPRLWGTFARVLGHYCREAGLFPLETAVHKMTGLTARNFGLRDRGTLKPGHYADITLFDAGTIGDAATFAQPVQSAFGIDTVIVNGQVVWAEGESTGRLPGRFLRR